MWLIPIIWVSQNIQIIQDHTTHETYTLLNECCIPLFVLLFLSLAITLFVHRRSMAFAYPFGIFNPFVI